MHQSSGACAYTVCRARLSCPNRITVAIGSTCCDCQLLLLPKM